MATKKLIEVALPLDKINAEAAREKSIRHGHPSTLHLWWARRPLAAARAVIWSSLVDDPSSRPEEFPTEEEQNAERERLFRILEDLVVWENSNNKEVLGRAKAEIMRSTGGNPPALLDPFAGGGAIPLEAQRLGLEAHAHDLNPVAVMINKAMIEIPPRFADMAPVNPSQRHGMRDAWSGATGLAEDIRYYGNWMKEEAFKRIGHLYPKVKVPNEQGGGEATVIAWIWARTVKCPNPACGCELPLVKSFDLSKKKGNEHHIEMHIHGNHIDYTVEKGKADREGTIATGTCPCCGVAFDFAFLRSEGKAGRLSERMVAIVAEGKNGRIYLSPTEEQASCADVEIPEDIPMAPMPQKALGFRVQEYGMDMYCKLFTPRQLTALTAFCSLVREAQAKAEADAITSGLPDDGIGLSEGGKGAKAYGEAVGVYLAFAIDKMADYHSSICTWHITRDGITHTFGRQAIPMTWDFAEANPFSDSSGCFDNMLEWVEKCVRLLPASAEGNVSQFDAQSDCGLRDVMVSTDPPYYDNIGYADLSDYFYIWMRQSLRDIYPELFGTMLVPKDEELIAAPHRHEGDIEVAKKCFEDGMASTCQQLYKYASDDVPVSIYYAYKQSDSDNEGTASSGWETMLNAIISAGFAITGTWPVRTELANRRRGIGSNALASSIVLVCRKRPYDAPVTTKKKLVSALRKELRPALKKLQQSNIAPVDLAQSAIGPGMAVFSRYSKVLGADGTPMSVRDALVIINEEIDLYFNDQGGRLDAGSRVCVDLFTQEGYNEVAYGTVQVLATAKGTSVESLAGLGVLHAKGGKVRLLTRPELSKEAVLHGGSIWLLAQQLTYAKEKGGNAACAGILAMPGVSGADQAKDLAYRLYTACDRSGWADEAYAYNALVSAWPEILAKAEELKRQKDKEIQGEFDF